MTAIRVIEDHFELENVGDTSHARIDEVLEYLTGTEPIIVTSASNILSGSRIITGGPGVSITDGGPGGFLTISFTATGSGDVVGPDAAEDQGVARFDGVTGKLITGSNVFIDDIGNLSVPSGSVTVSGSLTVTGSLTSPQIQPHSTTNPISLVTTGTVYFNSVIDELMYYDPERSKWLSVSVRTLQAGKNGRTQIGGFYRAIDKMTLNATDRGIPVPQGTLTGLGISKTDSFTSTVEVVVNGAVVTSLLHSTSGAIFNSNLNADFGSGSMSFRNASVGAVTDNVQVYAEFKRRI